MYLFVTKGLGVLSENLRVLGATAPESSSPFGASYQPMHITALLMVKTDIMNGKPMCWSPGRQAEYLAAHIALVPKSLHLGESTDISWWRNQALLNSRMKFMELSSGPEGEGPHPGKKLT